MRNKDYKIFYFFPLGLIGGTESVHTDVMKALKDYSSETFIRYRVNVWRGKEYARSKAALIEGRAMIPIFNKYSKTTVVHDWLEAPRLGRIVRNYFLKRLARKINSRNSIVIIWHREAFEYILPHINDDVPIIDIVHNNSNDEYPDAQYLNNDLVPRLNRRVLVSRGLYRWIDPLYQASGYEAYKDRIRVIGHTVHIPPAFEEKQSKGLRVLFIGRETPEKRIHLAEEIAAKCLELNLPYTFTMIGPVPKEETKNLQWVGLVSERSQMQEYYKHSDVVLMTSSSEGFPKVIAESMAYGCITIATDVGGISAHITDQVNGILTNPDKCVDESIHWLKELNNSTELKNALSQSAYGYAKEHFGFDNFKKNWLQLIDEVC